MPNDDLSFDLLRLVAHELKTPLNAVQGFIELIEAAGPLTDRQKHFLRTRALWPGSYGSSNWGFAGYGEA